MVLIPVLPPAMRKAAERLKQGGQKVAAVGTRIVREVIVDEAERARRLAICHRCPMLKPEPVEHCTLCGCLMSAKKFLTRTRCPDNPPRW